MLSSLSTDSPPLRLIAVGGPSGVGKSTTIDALLTTYPNRYRRPLSYTSRAPRDEHDRQRGEYIFASRGELVRLWEEGKLVTLDEAYGEYYGISRDSVMGCIESGVSPIKEIHPSNYERVALSLGAIRTVELLRTASFHAMVRKRGAQRAEVDDAYWEGRQPTSDVLHTLYEGDPARSAIELDVALEVARITTNLAPPAWQIDLANRQGYDMVASRFHDVFRVTTRNFHQLSLPLFQKAIDHHCSATTRCLEVGPGNGWLRREVCWPVCDYTSLDISSRMTNVDITTNSHTVGSCRALPFQSGSFDLVVASLADPFLYPLAICDMTRVLRRGGKLILSYPNHHWATGIRPEGDLHRTRFELEDGSMATVYSFSYEKDVLLGVFGVCGLSLVEYSAVKGCLLSGQAISPALTKAASTLGVRLAELEIVDFAVLRKTRE